MPNIEIHGFSTVEAEELEKKIFDLARGISIEDDLVVTTYPTRVVNRHGQAQPYFRFIHTADDLSNDVEDFIDDLRNIADAEEMEIRRFFPKRTQETG